MAKPPKNLSGPMFAFLNGVSKESIEGSMETFRGLDQRTFGAVLNRQYVKRGVGKLKLTPAGWHALRRYSESDVPHRQRPSNLSTLVSKLLHIKATTTRATHGEEQRTNIQAIA